MSRTEKHSSGVNSCCRQGMCVPSLLLTTTGRKSGEKYIFPLFYGEDDKNYIVVASKGGAPQHPNWYRNLVANPEVGVQVGTKTFKAKARTATEAERDRLWGKGAQVLATFMQRKLSARFR